MFLYLFIHIILKQVQNLNSDMLGLCFVFFHKGQKGQKSHKGAERREQKTIAAVPHKSSASERAVNVCLFILKDLSQIRQWFSLSHQLLQLLTINTNRQRGRVISCSSKKTIFISSCCYHLYCTNTTPTPIWPSASGNNLSFYHSCKRAKELSLFYLSPATLWNR